HRAVAGQRHRPLRCGEAPEHDVAGHDAGEDATQSAEGSHVGGAGSERERDQDQRQDLLSRPGVHPYGSTRTDRVHGGASGAPSPSRPTTTRMAFGAAAGHGVYPSVSTTVTAGLGRSAAAAPMPAPMSVPPPPISSTWRAELTRCA